MASLHSWENSAPAEDLFSWRSSAFGWKQVGELGEPQSKSEPNQSIIATVLGMGSLQKKRDPPTSQEGGDADHGDGHDDADGCQDNVIEVDVFYIHASPCMLTCLTNSGAPRQCC